MIQQQKTELHNTVVVVLVAVTTHYKKSCAFLGGSRCEAVSHVQRERMHEAEIHFVFLYARAEGEPDTYVRTL